MDAIVFPLKLVSICALSAGGGYLFALAVWHSALIFFPGSGWALTLGGVLATFAGLAGIVLVPALFALAWNRFIALFSKRGS